MKPFATALFVAPALILGASAQTTGTPGSAPSVVAHFDNLPKSLAVPSGEASSGGGEAEPRPQHLPRGAYPIGAIAPNTESAPGPIGGTFGPAPSSFNFQALIDNNTVIPPDTMGAVGPNHVMTILNSQVLIQDRNGGVISTVSLGSFWAPAAPPAPPFDPHLTYDPASGRWIACSAAGSNASSSVLIGVSQTSDPTGAWTMTKVPADTSGATWADYPTLGFNKDWIVVTTNMFSVSNGSSVNSRIWVFRKSDLYTAASSIRYTMLQDNSFGLGPAVTYDNSLATLYLVQTWNGNISGNGYVRISTITGAVGSETLNASSPYPVFVSTPNPWADSESAGAPQLGSNQPIDTDDDRITAAVYRNGYLFFAHTVFLPSISPTRSSVQWWQLTPAGTIVQRGLIDDPANVISYAYPSIAANKNNDVLIGYSRFAATQYASGDYAFRWSTDPANTTQSDMLYKSGEASYFKTYSGASNRWGDYSSTVVDPIDDVKLWTIQEYAASPSGSDRWGTWWTELQVSGCTATVTLGDWKGEYYSNTTLTGTPVMVRDDGAGALNFNWGSGSPSAACGVPVDQFSVRWTQTATFGAPGTYRFSTSSDDGMRLYVDGTKVQDRWYDQSASVQTVDVPLTAGSHTVVVEYYEDFYSASAAVSWQLLAATPTVASIIPASPYSTAGAQPVVVNGTNFQAGLTVDVFNASGTKLTTLSGTQISSVAATSFQMLIDFGGVAGTYGIEVVNTGNARSARFTFTVQPPVTTSCIGTIAAGDWKGEYYANMTLTGSPVMVRDDGSAPINFNWGSGSPSSTCGVPVNQFSVRWTQTATFSAATYRFSTSSDDGMRLYVDGTKVQDRWYDQSANVQTVDVPLTAGSHTVIVEYYQDLYTASAAVSWTALATAAAPAVTSISPASPFATSGAQPVTVNGSNFQAGLTVDVFDSTGSKITTLSGTQITNVTATSFLMSINFNGVAGSYGIEVVNPGGLRSARFTFTAQSSACIASTIPTGDWKGEYYANMTLAGSPVMVRDDGAAPLNFNWGSGTPSAACGIPVDHFSARWTQTANFAAATYRFSTSSDDGMRLYVDGTKVQDRWYDQSASVATVDVPLTAGAHTIVVEYYEDAYSASAAVSWQALSTVATPSVSSMNPASPYATPGNQSITVNGANFLAGLSVDVFNGAGTLVTSLTGTQISNVNATSFQILINFNGVAGSYGIEVVNPGGVRSARFAFTVQPPVTTSCIGTIAVGDWKGEYYANMTLTGSPVMVRDDDAGPINFNWGTGSPSTACGVPAVQFSVRWTQTATFSAGTYRFTTSSDDGMRLYVDGTKVLDRWFDQSATVTTVDVTLTAGSHTVIVEYYQDAYSASAAVSWQLLAIPAGCNATVASNHWKGEYYANLSLTGAPVMVRDDGAGPINFNWGSGSPSSTCGVPVDQFSARWMQTANFASAGTYRFSTSSDDGMRLYVDGNKVLDRWFDQSATLATVDVVLTAGAHTLVVEYYEDLYSASAAVSWTLLSAAAPAPAND